MQARMFEERLSAFEPSGDAGGLQKVSAGGNQLPPGFIGAGTSEQPRLEASPRIGVNKYRMLQTVGDEIEIAGGSSLGVGSREISSTKFAVSKFGSSVEVPLWKRRFKGFCSC